MDGGKIKIKCNICSKTINGHIFNRFGKTLCANCYSIEFQKKLNCGKYMVFNKKGNNE